MTSLGKKLVVVISLGMISVLALGVRQAMHSQLFVVRSIEVESSTQNPPLSDSAILHLASVPLGKKTLFDLDLKSIERRLLINDWIREVKLQKRNSHTLVIEVFYREPHALFQASKGTLSYVDADGKVFGLVNLAQVPDVPLISGLSDHNSTRIKEALILLDQWKNSKLSQYTEISSIHWENERGFRILAGYSFGTEKSRINAGMNQTVKTMIDLGQEIDDGIEDRFSRLTNVFRYLSENSIATHQIRADTGKKVVVKTSRGS